MIGLLGQNFKDPIMISLGVANVLIRLRDIQLLGHIVQLLQTLLVLYLLGLS